jgi:predicted TPR repeat methyltransferase
MASVRLLPDENPVGTAQALIADGRAGEAASLLQALLDGGRGGLLLRATLVQALIATNDIDNAIAVARETAFTNPSAATAAASLGEALLAAGTLATAIGEFQRALRIDPHFTPARILLGDAWLAAGEAEKALEAFDAIDAEDAPDGLAGRISNARAMRARPRSDPNYVRHLFDEFSADYDSRMLGQLGYDAPAILKQLAGMLGLAARAPMAILDLGCGTGLAGLAFKDMASSLSGIDLSPQMIEKARARGIYDVLRVSDLESELSGDGPSFDLIVAADTIVYLGDLAAIFAGAAKRLTDKGTFLFTVEKSDAADFELGPKRRWRHSERYLRELAERSNLDISGLIACHPRTEAGVPVEGLAVALSLRARPSWPHNGAARSMAGETPALPGKNQ